MLSSPPAHRTIRRLVQACQKHPARWLAPTVIITFLSFAYAQVLVRPERPANPTWMANRERGEPRDSASQNRAPKDTIVKWTQAADLASRELDACCAQLAVVESSAGENLDEFRSRSESPGADSNLRCALADVELALRQAENLRQSNREFVRLLETAQAKPGQLTAVPRLTLESQPALQQIREELVVARAHTTELLETMLPVHPSVQASLALEETICQRLRCALGTAADGLRAERPRLDERIATLTQESAQLQERLQRLSLIGSNRNRQLADIRKWTDTLIHAKGELAAAQGTLSDSQTVTPSSHIERPTTSGRDVRKVRALIVAAGLVGGWLIGMGILLLTSTRNAAVVSLPAATRLTVMSADQPAVVPVWQPLSPPVAHATTCAPRSSGHMTLRDALAYCAKHSNNR